MAKKPPAPPPPETPTGKTGPVLPASEPIEYDFRQYESFLQDGLTPGSGAPYPAVMAMFRGLVWDAYRRKVLDEPFTDALNHCCDLHMALVKLDDATELRNRLKKRGEDTPNLDKTIAGLVQTLKAHRTWAIEFIGKVKQCPLPGTPIH